MKCGVWNQMKIWSSHLLDNLSNNYCLMNLKNSGDSTGFEPMTSVMPVQCANQLSYEVTQVRAGHLVRIPLGHLNFSGSWDNCLNCPASARIISSLDSVEDKITEFANAQNFDSVWSRAFAVIIFLLNLLIFLVLHSILHVCICALVV